jgi:uncharacterized circularly permuted ATP-grasp superfamily protein
MVADGSNDLGHRASVLFTRHGKGVSVTATSPYPPSRARLIARPQDSVARPTIEISLHPAEIGDELRPRHVDLRPFVFQHGTGKAVVMPGGLTRVAFEEGAMVVNSTQNGGAKDTWVLP